MTNDYQPIKMRRTFEVIIDLLKERIFSGEYKPGDSRVKDMGEHNRQFAGRDNNTQDVGAG